MEPRGYRTLKTITMPGLRLSKTKYASGTLPEHTHSHARLVFVLSGEFAERSDGFQRVCSSGDVLLRRPGEKHSESFGPQAVVAISVSLKPYWCQQWEHHQISLSRSLSLQSGSAAGLAARLDDEFETDDTVSGLAIEAILLETIVEVTRALGRATGRAMPPWIQRAVDFIHSEHTRSLTLAEIGSAAGVHPVHLARMFRQAHGCSVGEYVRRLRITTARAALVKSSAPLADVAALAGFADQSHLCRTFRRLVGVTPGRYRLLTRR
jgi:AraC family transcriptional regulator